MFLAYWVHHLDPVAIRFPEGWFLKGIHWYGLAYATGFLIAAVLLHRWRLQQLTPVQSAQDESSLITAIMMGVILGGRWGMFYFMPAKNFMKTRP